MDIKLLTEHDTNLVRQFYAADTKVFNERINKFEIFSDTYLSNLRNYKAYASVENESITSIVGFYESADYPEWFVTYMMCTVQDHLRLVMNDAIDYNERKGKLRFFSLIDEKHQPTYNNIILSDEQWRRYGWFDDFMVKSKNKCIHVMPWHALYFRTLVDGNTIVRCNFLKQENRKTIPNGGNI